MVKMPVVTTLATEEPEIMPVMPEETTAAFAGPPRNWPSSEKRDLDEVVAGAGLLQQRAEQHEQEDELVDTPSATPNTPSEVSQKCEAARDDAMTPLCASRPGR